MNTDLKIEKLENGTTIISKQRYLWFIPIGYKVIREFKDDSELKNYLLETIKQERTKHEIEK